MDNIYHLSGAPPSPFHSRERTFFSAEEQNYSAVNKYNAEHFVDDGGLN